jgi:hypothetical protein
LNSRDLCQTNANGEQTLQANPFSMFNKSVYSKLKTTVVASAEKLPEKNYNFKPTDSVRSYGQIVGTSRGSTIYVLFGSTRREYSWAQDRADQGDES